MANRCKIWLAISNIDCIITSIEISHNLAFCLFTKICIDSTLICLNIAKKLAKNHLETVSAKPSTKVRLKRIVTFSIRILFKFLLSSYQIFEYSFQHKMC